MTDQKPFQNHPPESSQSNAIQKHSKPSNSFHYRLTTKHCKTTDNKTVEQQQRPILSNTIQPYPISSTISIQHHSKPSSTVHMQSRNIKHHQRLLKNVQTRPVKSTNIQNLQHCWPPSNTIQQHSSPFNNIQKRHWNPIQNRPTFFSNVQYHPTLSNAIQQLLIFINNSWRKYKEI